MAASKLGICARCANYRDGACPILLALRETGNNAAVNACTSYLKKPTTPKPETKDQ